MTKPTRSHVDLYLPAGPKLPALIAPRSGIVGQLVDDVDSPTSARVHVYYEGNLYGSESFRSYADRCYHAADRMIAAYPTVAQAMVSPDDVVLIGTLDMTFGEVSIEPEHLDALEAWLDSTEDGDRWRFTTGQTHEGRRTVRAWPREKRELLKQLPPRERDVYERAGLL